jgi:hypothetical protein
MTRVKNTRYTMPGHKIPVEYEKNLPDIYKIIRLP